MLETAGANGSALAGTNGDQMGWKTAGYWGLDRFLLPSLGTPRHAGLLLRRVEEGPGDVSTAPSES